MSKSLRAILASNVRSLKHHYGVTEKEIATKANLGTGSVNRVLNEQNVELDTLVALSHAFGIEAWELLIPGLIPGKPTEVLRTETQAELRALREYHRRQLEALGALSVVSATGGSSSGVRHSEGPANKP